jgi:uncharacterized protein
MNDYFDIKESKIHNKGAFAKKFIKKDTLVSEYYGELISKKEADRRLTLNEKLMKKDGNIAYTYIFELDDKTDLDGNIPNNDAKYINHSCEPNLRLDIKKHRVFLYALRDIKKGEELSYDYEFTFDEDTLNHKCKCGKKICVGYICSKADWDKLKALIKKRKSKLNK